MVKIISVFLALFIILPLHAWVQLSDGSYVYKKSDDLYERYDKSGSGLFQLIRDADGWSLSGEYDEHYKTFKEAWTFFTDGYSTWWFWQWRHLDKADKPHPVLFITEEKAN